MSRLSLLIVCGLASVVGGCRTAGGEPAAGSQVAASAAKDAGAAEPQVESAVRPANWMEAEGQGDWDLPKNANGAPPTTTDTSDPSLPNKAKLVVDCTDHTDCEQNRKATLLTVTTNAKNALILVDDILIGSEGEPLGIKPGSLNIEVRSPDYPATKLSVVLKPGEKKTVHVDFKK